MADRTINWNGLLQWSLSVQGVQPSPSPSPSPSPQPAANAAAHGHARSRSPSPAPPTAAAAATLPSPQRQAPISPAPNRASPAPPAFSSSSSSASTLSADDREFILAAMNSMVVERISRCKLLLCILALPDHPADIRKYIAQAADALSALNPSSASTTSSSSAVLGSTSSTLSASSSDSQLHRAIHREQLRALVELEDAMQSTASVRDLQNSQGFLLLVHLLSLPNSSLSSASSSSSSSSSSSAAPASSKLAVPTPIGSTPAAVPNSYSASLLDLTHSFAFPYNLISRYVIMSHAADVIASASQNNPSSQAALLQCGAIQALTKLLTIPPPSSSSTAAVSGSGDDTAVDERTAINAVHSKSLLALSCLIRSETADAFRVFVEQCNGYTALLTLFTQLKGRAAIKRKVLVLLRACCKFASPAHIQQMFVFLPHITASLIHNDDDNMVSEECARLLLTMTEGGHGHGHGHSNSSSAAKKMIVIPKDPSIQKALFERKQWIEKQPKDEQSALEDEHTMLSTLLQLANAKK